jgi:hypothetical protein
MHTHPGSKLQILDTVHILREWQHRR